MYIDSKKKNVLVLGETSTQGLNDTTITAEATYSINFSRSQRKFWLGLHYSGSNSFSFVITTTIYQFKAKLSKMKPYPLYLGSISKVLTSNNIKKTGLNQYVCDFSISYNIVDNSNIISIYKYC